MSRRGPRRHDRSGGGRGGRGDGGGGGRSGGGSGQGGRSGGGRSGGGDSGRGGSRGGSGSGKGRSGEGRSEDGRGASRSSHDRRERSEGPPFEDRGRGRDSGRSGSRGKVRGLGGEQVEGRQAIRELLLAGRRSVSEVLMASDLDPAPILDEIVELAREERVVVREIGRSKLESIARTSAPQGIIARAAALTPVPLDRLVRGDGLAKGQLPFLLALDGVTDPGNLGTLLRTAEGAGVTGVIIPRHRSARVTPAVAKAAAGAIEYLPMAQVGGLASAMLDLTRAGVWSMGLDGGGDKSLFDVDVPPVPVAVVLGAEGKGLSRLVGERCDQLVAIPRLGQLDSLNVAAAGAVACYEVARSRSR